MLARIFRRLEGRSFIPQVSGGSHPLSWALLGLQHGPESAQASSSRSALSLQHPLLPEAGSASSEKEASFTRAVPFSAFYLISPPQAIFCNCATSSPLPTLLCHPFPGVPHASARPLRFLLEFAGSCIPHLYHATEPSPASCAYYILHPNPAPALSSRAGILPGTCIPLGTMRRGLPETCPGLLGICRRGPGGVWLELSTGREARMRSCQAAPGSCLTSPELLEHG